MPKEFHVTGTCIPEKHYMVDVSGRVKRIVADYIEKGKYFTINRARQYGKTTIMYLLERQLKESYVVLSLSFESADELFTSFYTLAAGLIRRIGRELSAQGVEKAVLDRWSRPVSEGFPMEDLGERISELCRQYDGGVVLMIDEVDKSSDNQIFLSFLGLLRAKYLARESGKDDTFQSVILAGVYDIKNLKLHEGTEPKYNNPWNIAADFRIDLGFQADDIERMLSEYEADYHTGMDIRQIGRWIFEYTEGYPYMVSRMCKLLDERVAGAEAFPDKKDAWTGEGFQEAIRLFLKEPNMLFDDMVKKLQDNPDLKTMLSDILFRGTRYTFEVNNRLIDIGVMFGFVAERDNAVVVANRIFEMKLYNLFLSEEEMGSRSFCDATEMRSQFVVRGMLQMKMVLEKFCQYYGEICGEREERFLEEDGRRLFLLYLRPIINGSGNYYVEAQTRDRTRTDVIVDYRGQRFIIELKLWRGDAYHERGERQLFGYLEHYQEDTGYLLSFDFSKRKRRGMKEIVLEGKRIVEAVV